MVIPRREIERGRSQNTDEDSFVSQSGSSGTPSKVAGAGQDEVGEFRVKLVFEKDKAIASYRTCSCFTTGMD